MKIRHPLAIRGSAFILSLWLRGWMAGSPVHEYLSDMAQDPRKTGARCVFCFWHETIVPAAALYAPLRIPVLVSQHRDGELITQVLRFLGGDAVRGSTTRGGDKALRAMLAQTRKGSLAITPDGPRGPRRRLQQGAVFIASQAQIPFVPAGIHAEGCWRAKSWDRMMIPRPGRTVHVVVGEAINIPPDLDEDALEHYRAICDRALNQAQEAAEACASR